MVEVMESLKTEVGNYLSRPEVTRPPKTKVVLLNVNLQQDRKKVHATYGYRSTNITHTSLLKIAAVVLGILATLATIGVIWCSSHFKNLENRLIHGLVTPIHKTTINLPVGKAL